MHFENFIRIDKNERIISEYLYIVFEFIVFIKIWHAIFIVFFFVFFFRYFDRIDFNFHDRFCFEFDFERKI